jgi:hypothetical protein
VTSGGNLGLRVELSGTAKVYCVHDREKRQVIEERHVFELGLRHGYSFDHARDKIHLCSCCKNLFVDRSVEPRLCSVCQRPPVFALGGPLPEPKGVVA